ncbi:Carbohydrate-selective porin, OprB family [Planctomycetes bacterium CA13]|uniref:Carbohydrate-selective porin, OprB family n=1 Tax=Novipirellula herctigrandis TaxID=2527986 RepID=A0A5C5ZDU7_9BACT|nr:Carbohydrate-selective porin, OprB family [Planctomycetes bacterium CA13]
MKSQHSWTIWLSALVSFITVVATAQSLAGQDAGPPLNSQSIAQKIGLYLDIDQFGGPSSVSGQLAEDSNVNAAEYRCERLQQHFEPWFEFKQRLDNSCGLQLSIDESMFYQTATSSLGETDAASGLVRVYGQWTLLGRGSNNPGQLVFKGENRHRMTAITPFDLGFEAGSILPTGTFFNEFNFGVTNLYWKQYFYDRDLVFAVGKIDVTDFIDVYALMNPLMHFINLGFSTNPTIAVPNQGLGMAAGAMLTDRLYLQGGFSDANGQPTLAGFDTFFDEREYFSYLECGLTSSRDRIYLDNVHATFWHSDARAKPQTPEGWGVALTAQKFLHEKWLPFFRFGYSDGDAALMQTTFSTGLGMRRENNDVAGIGISFGKPADGTLRDQFTSEVFYRFQLTQSLAITPDVQLIADPALHSKEDVMALFGIRLRASF